jgi:hypothetical protein
MATSKDLEILNLQMRIDFTIRQLEEREEQLQHYRQLATTLQDLLNTQAAIEESHKSYASEQQVASSSPKPQKLAATPKKKNVSFHNDVEVHYIQVLFTSSSATLTLLRNQVV